MYRRAAAYRLVGVYHDMPVGSKPDPAMIDLCPADCNDLVLPGVQTGQFEIHRNQRCIDQVIGFKPGTGFNIGYQAGLPALMGKHPAASAQAPLPEHQ